MSDAGVKYKKAKEAFYSADAAFRKAAAEYKANPRPTRADMNAFEDIARKADAAALARKAAQEEYDKAHPPVHVIYR